MLTSPSNTPGSFTENTIVPFPLPPVSSSELIATCGVTVTLCRAASPNTTLYGRLGCTPAARIVYCGTPVDWMVVCVRSTLGSAELVKVITGCQVMFAQSILVGDTTKKLY